MLTLALVGKPNCGKTALFNRLTGARQKVANYAGVTVERKEGRFTSASGRAWRILDLPGAYSLRAASPDEAVTRDVLAGARGDVARPDGIICVVDATNLQLNLRMVLELRRLGLPMVVALNMADVARRRGIRIDVAALARTVGVPVVETVAIRRGGEQALLEALERFGDTNVDPDAVSSTAHADTPEELRRSVAAIIAASVTETVPHEDGFSERLDRLVLHPLLGPAILLAVLFLVFQAVFSWAQAPMEWIQQAVAGLGDLLASILAEGPLRSLLVDGILGGVGSVLVFLPQIQILFLFILALED
ncbi:MAG: ferrous iron transporter B, partial [Gammaproteobacteria bacterium]|nr:ferrous iron transporter B [Gammaproteobacteria bacterium]